MFFTALGVKSWFFPEQIKDSLVLLFSLQLPLCYTLILSKIIQVVDYKLSNAQYDILLLLPIWSGAGEYIAIT
jgi:hypothetical protein